MTSGHDRREVVVADDDLLFSSRLSAALVRMGYRPVVARSGAAIDAAVREAGRGGSLRAVIFNLAARGFDATEAVRRIRGDGTIGRIPLLGFCGHRDVARAEAAQAAGCDAVTTNGVIAADLERVLRPLLEPISPPARGT
jgi:CheY-like chemotaxis protein